jgi:GNAT superfamily N-acetyltransferase
MNCANTGAASLSDRSTCELLFLNDSEKQVRRQMGSGDSLMVNRPGLAADQKVFSTAARKGNTRSSATLSEQPMSEHLTRISHLDKSRVKKAGEVCARAFFDYPMQTFLLPKETERAREGPAYFQALVRYVARYGEVYAPSDDIEAVALWLPSETGFFPITNAIYDGLLFRLLAMGVSFNKKHFALDAIRQELHQKNAPLPHHYLNVLAVDPAHQGKRLASKLLNAMFEQTDALGRPCYLETYKALNARIYQRYGFETIERRPIPAMGLECWSMLRPPQS